MQLKINVLTKIESNKKHTIYFLHKPSKTILPIEISNILDKTTEDTYIRTLKALSAEIISIHLYLYLDDIYYVYLKIKANNDLYDINSSITNAMYILENIPSTEVFVEKAILETEGIKITKELLEKSLLF